MAHPQIIQGGMGAGVSDWRLARAVSQAGQLGVVSGTALAAILVRRLQTGDAGGQMRHALAQFPVPGDCGKNSRGLFHSRRQARHRAVQTHAAARLESRRGLCGADRRGKFCGGFSREGKSRRTGRHQFSGKNPVPHIALDFRRDARRRGLCADGRGHSARHPRRARPAGARRGGGVEN